MIYAAEVRYHKNKITAQDNRNADTEKNNRKHTNYKRPNTKQEVSEESVTYKMLLDEYDKEEEC